jgi:hypothetical protein
MATPISQVIAKSAYIDRFRDPAITAYNRLEGRPRTVDFTRSLRAEIRDALWLLTRQWQLGELTAEDGGSPIDARLLTRHAEFDRVVIGTSTPIRYDRNVPLEVTVEAEHFPWSLPARIEAGQIFLRLLPAGFPAAALGRLHDKFGLAPLSADELRQSDAVALDRIAQARALDGETILAAHGGGTLNSTLLLSGADATAASAAADGVAGWRARIFGTPPPGPSPAWQTGNLAYDVTLASPAGDSGQAVLEARRHTGGRLDWYSFDAAPGTEEVADPGGAPPAATEEQPPLSFVPTAAAFPGMPNPRFWEMEDRRINFGSLNARTTDQVLLVFAELGLIFGNDWFVIPYEMPVNHLCETLGLVVTDVFGDRTLIPAANEGDEAAWQKWSLFSVTGDTADSWSGRYFWIPATLTSSLESEPIEEVIFARDEMANLVWAIEKTVPDATGKGIAASFLLDEPAPPPPFADPAASARYTLGTVVPENWVPFLPVHIPGSIADIRFQRGTMPATGGAPPRRRGTILQEVPAEFFIAEEEVPVSGLVISRRVQRTRWYDGRTYLWIGRARETGWGGANSHLRFDKIDDQPQ